VEIDVVVRGDQEAERLLERLGRRLEDGRPQLLALVDQLLALERLRFMGQGGARWRKLAASTVAKDRQQHRDPRPMILTGRLMRSLTERGAPDQFIEVTPGMLRFGTRVYYARFHQRGKGVPRRAVVGATRRDRVLLVERLKALLLEDL
jgi:phage gpG-like protein